MSERDELGYATRLAESLWRQYYKADAPDWQPLDTVAGVLTQIDNMVSGMTRATPQPAMPEGWKLVPEQPTDRMVGVAIRKRDDYSDIHAGRKSYPYAETCELYRAMLAAAPQPSQEPEKAPITEIPDGSIGMEGLQHNAFLRRYQD